MDKLNERLLGRIEQILNIRFEEWQVDYMLDRPQVLDMRITGRATGKTLVYIIKLLFSEGDDIKAYDKNDMARYSDWWCTSVKNEPISANDHYVRFFTNELVKIYDELIVGGLTPRQIYTKK